MSRSRVFLPALLALCLALMTSACGSDDTPTGPAAGPSSSDQAAAWQQRLVAIADAQERFYERYGTFTANWDDLGSVSAPVAAYSDLGERSELLDDTVYELSLRTVSGGQSYRMTVRLALDEEQVRTFELLRDPDGRIRYLCHDNRYGCRKAETGFEFRPDRQAPRTRRERLVPITDRNGSRTVSAASLGKRAVSAGER